MEEWGNLVSKVRYSDDSIIPLFHHSENAQEISEPRGQKVTPMQRVRRASELS
jgi:hypothetical protein